ncbi:MAG: GNAT family N-acetyltransferase [Sphingomonas adhaesiva]|uniref:GNAT family N-acetyltransferase n=1 Tax=Sphingomonas adhaesiva TaxID=28212 RepID=UPI002FF77C81
MAQDVSVATTITLDWDKSPAAAAAAAALAGRIIGADTAYISHGEIQTGLSIDAETWAPSLPDLYAGDFAALGDERDLLLARDAMGTLLGMAVVAWEQSSRRRFAVVEDMVVAPDARSHGVGTRLIEMIERRVREAGVDWIFLESGVRNTRAHAFFERSGFAMTSHVFARRLG